MGFFKDLGKAIAGRPMAETGPAPVDTSQASLGGNVYKIIPTIELKDIWSHRQGNQLIVTAWVENTCDQIIRVDTCYLLKQKQQYNQMLNPGQSHQMTLYRGAAPRDETEHQARIIYRLQTTGDSFQVSYQIKYHLESDGTRTVDELHPDGPVKDV